MKSSNVWRCSDCRKVGFYYGLTDEEIIEEHRKKCTGVINIAEADWLDWSNMTFKEKDNETI
jgi:hypothetical protein